VLQDISVFLELHNLILLMKNLVVVYVLLVFIALKGLVDRSHVLWVHTHLIVDWPIRVNVVLVFLVIIVEALT